MTILCLPRSSTISALPRIAIDAATRPVGFADRFVTQDRAAGRENPGLERWSMRSSSVASGVVDQRHDRIGDLVEIVRRNVRRHADGDAARAVDEQLREAARKHARLDALIVEVRDEWNGLFIDVGENVERRPRQAAPRCSGRRPAGRDRSIRSCRARRPADSAA